jgi:hypothetical protein
MTVAYTFAHEVMPLEFTTRLDFARAEWHADRAAYLRGRWMRAAVTSLRLGILTALDSDPPELTGSEHEWPDGTRALVIGIPGPYAIGEAIFCGVFWHAGDPASTIYLLLEQGSGRTILASRRDGAHFNHGPAHTASAADFAALGKARLHR